MNPLVLFLPTYRASTTAYLLGLLVLAALDYARLTVGIPGVPGWLPMLVMWFFVFSLHANRRRHAGESVGFAFLPTVLAIIGQLIGFFVGIGTAAFESMKEFAAANGVDTDDQQAFLDAIGQPGFQQAWQEALEADPAAAEQMAQAIITPSFIGFWLVIGLFAIWFAQMTRSGGSVVEEAAPAPVPAETPEASAETAPEADDVGASEAEEDASSAEETPASEENTEQDSSDSEAEDSTEETSGDAPETDAPDDDKPKD